MLSRKATRAEDDPPVTPQHSPHHHNVPMGAASPVSQFDRRTPRSYPTQRIARSPSRGRREWAQPAVARGAGSLDVVKRVLRSKRVVVTLLVVSSLSLFALFAGAGSNAIKHTPIRSALAPILRKSGQLLKGVAPAAGHRVEDYLTDDPKRPRTPEELEAMKEHTFHPNGLLLVNPLARHPIHVLMERAQKEWDAKVARQSKTLEEAVAEYKTRYHRNPPKGFDDWWDFAERNNVQLRDEYDQIDHDMAPHRALEPGDSRHRNRVMQSRDHTFTIAMKPGEPRPKSYGQHGKLKRATDVSDVLAIFSGMIPRPINLTFIVDDNPAVMLPFSQRDRMVELSAQGEYFGPSEFVEADDPTLSNFAQACANNSPLRKAERGESIPDFAGSAVRSFIWDHSKAADLCNHPEMRKLHGHTMQQGVPLSPLVPLFTFAKTKLHADILVTPLEQYSSTYLGYDAPWDQKAYNKLLWRGSTTGVEFDKHTPWKLSQRVRLHMMGQSMEGEKDVIWSQRGATKQSTIAVEKLNHLYMDTSFTTGPVQCDPETCEIMSKTMDFKDIKGLDDSLQYKYMMDVDGNGWSGRFHRLMSSRSLVLKSTVFPEWYADRIQPWVHYVPIKVDYSDLYDTMAFFIGTPDGRGSHDSLAEKLGENGRIWARDHWRKVDMAAYMYRLVLEYSRILAEGEEEVDYLDSFVL